MRSIRSQAFAQGPDEIGIGPSPDSEYGIGSDIGPVEGTKGCVDGAPTCQEGPLVLEIGMTSAATGYGENIGTARHSVSWRFRGRRARREQNQKKKNAGECLFHGECALITGRRSPANQACVTE